MFTALIRIVENNNTALGRLVEDFFATYTHI